MSRPPTRNPRILRIASVHHVCPVCHIFRPMRCIIFAYLCFPLTYATYVRCWGAYAGHFGAYLQAYVTYLMNARNLTTYTVHLHVFYAYLCLPLTYTTYVRCWGRVCRTFRRVFASIRHVFDEYETFGHVYGSFITYSTRSCASPSRMPRI